MGIRCKEDVDVLKSCARLRNDIALFRENIFRIMSSIADELYPTDYYSAYCALLGIETLVLLPVAVLSIFKARSRNDATRKFVPWFKAAIWLFWL